MHLTVISTSSVIIAAVIPAVVAAVGGACALLLIITVSIISLILCSKWQRKNRRKLYGQILHCDLYYNLAVEHKTETVYAGNMPEEMSKRSGFFTIVL